MEDSFKQEYMNMRKNKFRTNKDVVISFAHAAYMNETGRGVYESERRRYFYNRYGGDVQNDEKAIKGMSSDKIQCICLNDGFNDKNVTLVDQEIDRLNKFFFSKYPDPTPFEYKGLTELPN